MQQLPEISSSKASTQTVVRSFDSSLIYSYPASTQSALSNNEKKTSQHLSQNINYCSNLSQSKPNQIQMARFQQQHSLKLDEDFSFHSVGFVVGKEKKPIQINVNQIKRSKNFFDDTPPQSQQQENEDQNNTLPCLPVVSRQKFETQEFSIPCFKTGGLKGFNVNINEQFLSRAKHLLSQEPQMSDKKPTKLKKAGQKQLQKDLIKTANYKTKTFDFTLKKIQRPKKQTFDWDQYQKNIQNEYQNTKCQVSLQKQKYFTIVKIKDLNIQTVKQAAKIQEFKIKSQNIFIDYLHNRQNCPVIGCLICKLDCRESQINVKSLHQIFIKKLTIYPISYERFIQIYAEVYNKLLKYQIFHPQISNKKLNPSVILYEIFKKQQKINRQKYNGWISYVLQQNNHYNGFIAYVKSKYYFQKMSVYFIQLSDGWSSLWAIIQKSNALYPHIEKIKLCSKIFVSYWTFYPLSNILTYCPLANSNEKCIQIYYNSTIMINQNARIGKPSYLFYRPLQKCKKDGGSLPTVEGTIVRMFYLKQNKKQLKAISMRENYLQILTPQGLTVLIRFILSQQNTLAQLFRLYYTYHFYYLRIANQNQLCFALPHSKFHQLPYDKKNPYSSNLILLLKKRYINLMDQKLLKQLKTGECYDFKIQNNEFQYETQKYRIQIQDQNQEKGVALYQQLIVSFNDENSKQIILKKYKYSNTLKSLPKIYKLISQNQL